MLVMRLPDLLPPEFSKSALSGASLQHFVFKIVNDSQWNLSLSLLFFPPLYLSSLLLCVPLTALHLPTQRPVAALSVASFLMLTLIRPSRTLWSSVSIYCTIPMLPLRIKVAFTCLMLCYNSLV